MYNWLGHPKSMRVEGKYSAYKYKYSNKVTYNGKLTGFSDREYYKRLSELKTDEYFSR